MTGFEREVDLSDYATRVMPKAKNGVRLPEKYIDSPHIDPNHPVIKVIEYEVDYDGEFDNLPQYEKDRVYRDLRRCVKKDFAAGRDIPRLSYKLSFLPLSKSEEYNDFKALEHYSLGDTIQVYEADYDLLVEAQIVAFEWDILKKRYISMTLGSFKDGLVRRNFNQQSTIGEQLEAIKTISNKALISAGGKTASFYGSDEPENPQKGDLWFKKNGSADEIWQYQEVDGRLMWVILMSTQLIDELRNTIDTQVSETKELFKTYQVESSDKLAVILDKTNVNESLAAEAKTLSQEARDRANRAFEEALRINQSIDETKAELKVTNDTINAKVSKTDFDRISQTLSHTETTVSEVAGELQKKLSRSDIDRYLADKEVITRTQFHNVEETVSHYVRTIGTTSQEIGEKLSQLVMTNESFVSRVGDLSSGLSTLQRQFSNSWAVQTLTKSGDVLSELNANSGGVKISGRLIHLDGQTVIDQGVIKDAMIETVSADKLTVGTIDANAINLINLNASHITSGELSANLIRGGLIRALQNDMTIDLDRGEILSTSLKIGNSTKDSRLTLTAPTKLYAVNYNSNPTSRTPYIRFAAAGANLYMIAGRDGIDRWAIRFNFPGLNALKKGDFGSSFGVIFNTSNSASHNIDPSRTDPINDGVWKSDDLSIWSSTEHRFVQ